jgi:hypothetical protein
MTYSISIMKKKYRTVRSVPKSNMKILKTEAKPLTLRHIYMTAFISDLVHAL